MARHDDIFYKRPVIEELPLHPHRRYRRARTPSATPGQCKQDVYLRHWILLNIVNVLDLYYI